MLCFSTDGYCWRGGPSSWVERSTTLLLAGGAGAAAVTESHHVWSSKLINTITTWSPSLSLSYFTAKFTRYTEELCWLLSLRNCLTRGVSGSVAASLNLRLLGCCTSFIMGLWKFSTDLYMWSKFWTTHWNDAHCDTGSKDCTWSSWCWSSFEDFFVHNLLDHKPDDIKNVL